jgi:hypothetical protein
MECLRRSKEIAEAPGDFFGEVILLLYQGGVFELQIELIAPLQNTDVTVDEPKRQTDAGAQATYGAAEDIADVHTHGRPAKIIQFGTRPSGLAIDDMKARKST